MPIGFEVALPSLIDVAKDLGIEIPNDSSGVQEIYRRRNLKLTRYVYKDSSFYETLSILSRAVFESGVNIRIMKPRKDVQDKKFFLQVLNLYRVRDRIPKDILYSVPTTLLYSLEGLPGLDWQKLLKLQWPNGSFCLSPASTAFALQQTKDENCFRFLEQIVKKFNGGGNSGR